MTKATIDYMNARRELKAASGGKTYSREARQAPDSELDPIDRTAAECDAAWIDARINADAMWQRIFAKAGFARDIDQAPVNDDIPF